MSIEAEIAKLLRFEGFTVNEEVREAIAELLEVAEEETDEAEESDDEDDFGADDED
jgi:hypothetical protein